MTQVMQYDESVTYLLFGKSFQDALTDYGYLGPVGQHRFPTDGIDHLLVVHSWTYR